MFLKLGVLDKSLSFIYYNQQNHFLKSDSLITGDFVEFMYG